MHSLPLSRVSNLGPYNAQMHCSARIATLSPVYLLPECLSVKKPRQRFMARFNTTGRELPSPVMQPPRSGILTRFSFEAQLTASSYKF